MKILDAKIDWMHTWGNHPRLLILLYEYEEKNGLYLAQQDFMCSFYFYERPGQGFGGAVFDVKMKDGSTRKLQGPWSSNSEAINEVYGTQIMEIAYTADPKAWERGYTFVSASIDLRIAKERILEIVRTKQHPNIKLIKSRGFYTFGVSHIAAGEEKRGWYKPAPTDEELEKINKSRIQAYEQKPSFICEYEESKQHSSFKEASNEQVNVLNRI